MEHLPNNPKAVNTSEARAFVVEDDSFSNAMLVSFLSGLGYFVDSAFTGATAIATVDEFDPDVAIIDIDLGDGPSGVDVATHIYSTSPWCAIVMLSSHSSPGLVSSRLLPTSPYLTYLVKKDLRTADDLRIAVESVLEGRGEQLRTNTPDVVVTSGQAELLRFIARGLSNDEIAQRKGVRTSSVERMIARLYRELDLPQDSSVNLRVEAARRYIAGGIGVR